MEMDKSHYSRNENTILINALLVTKSQFFNIININNLSYYLSNALNLNSIKVI